MFSVTAGTQNYLSELYAIMLEWAEFEGIMHVISITEEEFGSRLFCDEPTHFSAIALMDDKIIGFTLFNFTQDNLCIYVAPGMFIESMYVSPNFRQKGLGEALFSHVVSEAKKHHCSRLEGWVFTNDTFATAFYKSQGAVPLDNLTVYRKNLTS